MEVVDYLYKIRGVIEVVEWKTKERFTSKKDRELYTLIFLYKMGYKI